MGKVHYGMKANSERSVKVGAIIRINCPHSKYDGVIGEVFEIEESTGYAIVDMPKGTEERIEGLRENAIIADMMRREKNRKMPVKLWPNGDPEWFPLSWLIAAEPEEVKARAAAASTDDSPASR